MDIVNLIISGTLLAMFSYMFYRISSNASNSKLTIGQWLNVYFNRNDTSVILILVCLANIMESLVASSIHKPGEYQINPIARTLMHSSFGFISIVASINAPKKLIELVMVLQENGTKEKPVRFRWLRAFFLLMTFLLLLFLSFVLPYWNVRIMANGLNESKIFDMAINQLNPWFKGYKYGIPTTYHAIDEMSMYMLASYYALLAHYGLSILDSCYALNERLKYGIDQAEEMHDKKAFSELLKTDEVKPDAKPGDKKTPPVTPSPAKDAGKEVPPSAPDAPTTPAEPDKGLAKLREILKFFNLSQQSKMFCDNEITKIISEKLTNTQTSNISNYFSEQVEAIQALEKNRSSLAAAVFNQKQVDLRAAIRTYLEKNIVEGGLEFSIPYS